MEKKEQLNNIYVRQYYNKQVRSLGVAYTDSRWFSSAERRFEYAQTSRSIDKALGSKKYKRAIEIGPGDAVWTKKLLHVVLENIHLIDQSDVMLTQAKAKLQNLSKISFERSDFMKSDEKTGVDLVMAIRCFEYFDNKKEALEKIRNTLTSGGKLILITKNSKLITSGNIQTKLVHSGQMTRESMIELLQDTGFEVEAVYPAVMRWKIKYASARWFFDVLHKISIYFKGGIPIPIFGTYATESYAYIARRPLD